MNAPRRWAAVIVAAGRGTRFGRPKQFLELAGLPMVGWSLQTFARMPEIEEIAIATEPESLEPMRELAERIAPGRVGAIVAGGSSRQGSSYQGVRAVSEACDGVLVHDGARPLVREDDVRAGMAEVRDGRGALLAAPAIDTIKVVDASTRRVPISCARTNARAKRAPR